MNLSGEDKAWMRALGRTAAERAIKEHVNCLEMFNQVQGHLENATQEARDYAQVFVAAYAKDPRCFDLPDPTPKCVAILNLSGERFVVYSKHLALARALTTAGLHQNDEVRVAVGVEKVIQHAAKHGCTLLLTLSLPWQATVPHLQWELHTLKRLPDGTVDDGGCVLFKGVDMPRPTRSTAAACAIDQAVLSEQIEALKVQLKAVCVDPDVDAEEDVDNEHRLVQFRKICATLQSERKTHESKLQEKEEQHVAELANATRSADSRMKRITFDWLAEKEKLLEKVDAGERLLAVLRLEKEELLRERSEQASKDLREEQDAEKLAAAVKLAGVETAAATAAKEKAEESLRIERETNAMARDAAVASHERRLSAKTLEITRLRGAVDKRGDAVTALEAVVDRLRAEKEGLQSEMTTRSAAQQRQIRMQRLLIAFARVRFDALSARSATANTGVDAAKADKGAADGDAALTASTDVTASSSPASAVVVPTTADAATVTEPLSALIHGSKEVSELTELVQKLHAQHDAATARAETGANANAEYADLEPATRALVQQGLSALHALARSAQSNAEHKLHAERLQGEIAGYQQMAAAAMYPAQGEGWDGGYDAGYFYNPPMAYNHPYRTHAGAADVPHAAPAPKTRAATTPTAAPAPATSAPAKPPRQRRG
tara:strand:- start:314 stop:2302 length:1989 start_codon:yes stop_codon:yes gene_type:complete